MTATENVSATGYCSGWTDWCLIRYVFIITSFEQTALNKTLILRPLKLNSNASHLVGQVLTHSFPPASSQQSQLNNLLRYRWNEGKRTSLKEALWLLK